MNRVTKLSDLWPPCYVKSVDIKEAIDYATVSIPWTFDRLRYGPHTQNAVNRRLLHILNGVLNQTILERELTSRGYECAKDWKNYRDSDVFDFRIGESKFDVKTVIVYSEYNEVWNRKPFTHRLLIENKSYAGPEWKLFFPMMVTTSQLTVEKTNESYIFGIAETEFDLRTRNPHQEDEGFWCAVPYSDAHSFFHSPGVIRAREEAGQGFRVEVKWDKSQLDLEDDKGKKVKLTLFGEWSGKTQTETITVREESQAHSKREFSSLSCVRLEHPAVLSDFDTLTVKVENAFKEFVPKPTSPLVNLNDPGFEWSLDKSSFVNLKVPDGYKLHWIGHIPFVEFASTFSRYSAYFIPLPGRSRNQSVRLTPGIRSKFETLDRRRDRAIQSGVNVPWPSFRSLIKGRTINAGFLAVSQGRAQVLGAACYYYPPYAMQETAVYVLPCDLHKMDSLR